MIISIEGKGIVMRHEDLRDATRNAAENSTRKLATRLTPGEKSNRKRMAQVATVYSIAPFPRSASDILHTVRDADEVDAKTQVIDLAPFPRAGEEPHPNRFVH